MTALVNSPSFTGLISYGGLRESSARTLLIDDSGLLEETELSEFGSSLADRVVFRQRPYRANVAALAARIQADQVERLVAVGSGALIDAAKLVLLHCEASDGHRLELVFVPCGREPYRAVARFSVVDEPDGSRPTVLDARFAAAEVAVLPWLLERVPEQTLAIAALDTSVQAIESLLSSRSTPMSRLLAAAALRTATRGITSEPSELLTASFAAVEAFASTRLGLAHALASPLGTELGITHDTINGVLGEPLLEFWGEDVAGFEFVADACGVDGVAAVGQVLGELRERAGLPATLEEFGAGWLAIAHVLPRSVKSSGIEVLPAPVDVSGLEVFARRAWKGRIDQEVIDAEPA